MFKRITVTRTPAEHGTREGFRFEGVLTENEVKAAISDFLEKRENVALMSQHPLFPLEQHTVRIGRHLRRSSSIARLT